MTPSAGLAIVAFLGHAASNVDNTLLIIALMPAFGRAPVLTIFASVQIFMIVLSGTLGNSLEALLPFPTGWLGLVPIGLGVLLWKKLSSGAESPFPRTTGLAAIGLTFAVASLDTLAILAALFADAAGAFDPMILLGAAASLGTLLLVGSRLPAVGRARHVVSSVAPLIMIGVGCAIIANSVWDVN